MSSEIFDDLQAEQDALEAVLCALDEQTWSSPSAAAGWSIADVVLHLAQTEEAVSVTVARHTGDPVEARLGPGTGVDEWADQLVRQERAEGTVVLERWQTARRAALQALRTADPQRRLGWVAASLRPRTLATTRLAEHWAHALDITEALGVSYPDTDRLRHVAWLGHSTLPYAFGVEGAAPQPVYCELTAPGGQTWRFGPAGAASTIRGAAGAFCRVGARRLSPESSGLVTSGPHGPTALRLLRNYAA